MEETAMKLSRPVRFGLEYAIAFDEVKSAAFRVGPKANVGTWGEKNGRKRARKLARQMARQAMKQAL
jgi:hypothetical protein